MDITKRQITKIAREVSKFTIRTLREDGIGTAEFDVIHAIRKNPGIHRQACAKSWGSIKELLRARRRIWRLRDI